MGNFQKLKVWQRSKELAVYLYRVTGQGVFAKDWGLRDQIRRAAVSVPSNIAEGDELETDRQAIKFFYIANEIGYLVKQDFDHARNECQAISKMLTRLIQARSREVP